ncbi:TadE/TadG family type IV pilus assembly protein [Propionicimonas sp.]|uniref:TadE/TadG family type IV pilus assembly protein n=1 Tax=Propionicimonas sp. TaxID=1955623 RepID=UPI00180C58B4|nr:TadE/TadG family type IV pilus assembly protein [Propionicimonas sp.]MBA3019660.1 pilus assembly protein [Propionicimonas sp.]MBU4207995.1 pilus assembly protein [Actinomycetota bacterium]MBU4411467.1 pilus assembly protein [Actinomycetota bacterium]MCG2805779.1 pilus assembly protein [Propionicimonas sp.]
MTTPTHSRSGDQRGNAALQTAILAPAMLALAGVIIQGGLWYHARDVAIAAAEEGARASASQDGTSSAGRSAAVSFATRTGSGFFKVGSVEATRGATSTTVVVEGESTVLVPWLHLPISQSATLPVERTT